MVPGWASPCMSRSCMVWNCRHLQWRVHSGFLSACPSVGRWRRGRSKALKMSAVNNNFKKWSQTLYHTIQSDISINYTDRVLYRICSFWLRQYWTRVSMTIIPSRMMGSIWRRDFSQLNIQKSWKRVQQQQHKAKGNYISIQNISLVLCFKWWGLFFLESVDVGRFLRVL